MSVTLAGPQLVHASCVQLAGQGVLIRGAAGSGKSSLALRLLALGAGLVADDQVHLMRSDGRVIATAPPGLPSLIEARGIGLLRATLVGPAPLALVVDLGADDQRLPPLRQVTLLDIALPLVHGRTSGHLAAAIRQYLLWGREA